MIEINKHISQGNELHENIARLLKKLNADNGLAFENCCDNTRLLCCAMESIGAVPFIMSSFPDGGFHIVASFKDRDYRFPAYRTESQSAAHALFYFLEKISHK